MRGNVTVSSTLSELNISESNGKVRKVSRKLISADKTVIIIVIVVIIVTRQNKRVYVLSKT